MNNKLTSNPPKFPQLATVLVVVGALLSQFLLPLIAPAGTTSQLVGRTMAFGMLASGAFLAMRHYWLYDRPLFKRKLVLLALGIALITCSLLLINHHLGVSAIAVQQ